MVYPDTCCLLFEALAGPSGHAVYAFGIHRYSFKPNMKPAWRYTLSRFVRLAGTHPFIMKIAIVNYSHHPLPQYATPLSAGLDLRANLDEQIVLQPLERRLIPTGLRIALPAGYEAQVRPRSGLALKKGITILNSPGTIDADYRGEIGVVLVNLSAEAFTVADGDRIAQLVIARHERAEWEAVNTLDETLRGEGGFGHSGV